MDLNLKDKVIIVTGSAGKRGSIGQTIAFSLANEGAIPVLLDRNNRGVGYEEELKGNGADALFVKTDLGRHEQIRAAIDQTLAKYGRIDGVVNNVGVNDSRGLDSSMEEFEASLRLNLISFFATVKYALPALKLSHGPILNIGSKVAFTGQGGTSGYAASKGGVLGLTREWAVDLVDYKIRVNALIIAESYTPAYQEWIDTLQDGPEKLRSIREKIPLDNRMTTAEEVADTALWLLSERSSHTTGQFVFVDGGYVHLDRAMLPKKE